MPARRTLSPAPKQATNASLTELEGVVVGIAHRDGPCTAYEIRRLLAASPSTQWSGSAGAVYPLVRRLTGLGFLRAISHPVRTKSMCYVATPKGVDALRAWMGPPFGDAVRTVSHDPLRSRAAMLAILGGDERRAWVAAALGVLDEVEAAVTQWSKDHADDPVSELLTIAGRADIAARREWLKRAIKIVPDSPPARRTKGNP